MRQDTQWIRYNPASGSIEELGPVFIKLGQVLSTRPDLVGTALADAYKAGREFAV